MLNLDYDTFSFWFTPRWGNKCIQTNECEGASKLGVLCGAGLLLWITSCRTAAHEQTKRAIVLVCFNCQSRNGAGVERVQHLNSWLYSKDVSEDVLCFRFISYKTTRSSRCVCAALSFYSSSVVAQKLLTGPRVCSLASSSECSATAVLHANAHVSMRTRSQRQQANA